MRGTLCWPPSCPRAFIQPAKAPDGAPNIVAIILDDVGFADLGCYGGEIRTPNFDALAAEGLRYSNFRTCAMCSPTRAAFLTGLNHHSAGMGWLADIDSGYPGYRGEIAADVFRAALAHVGAHLTYGGPRLPLGQLKPLQVAVVSLSEDARVERLAIRDFPGLARLWLRGAGRGVLGAAVGVWRWAGGGAGVGLEVLGPWGLRAGGRRV